MSSQSKTSLLFEIAEAFNSRYKAEKESKTFSFQITELEDHKEALVLSCLLENKDRSFHYKVESMIDVKTTDLAF